MLHYYYGEGKGKTSCACGIIIRAIGHGYSFFWISFFKNTLQLSGEYLFLKQYATKENVWSFGLENWVDFENVSLSDKKRFYDFYENILERIKAYNPDFLVFDELGYALFYEWLDLKDWLSWVSQEKQQREIIVTGRPYIALLEQYADYATCFKNIKYPSLGARAGVEF